MLHGVLRELSYALEAQASLHVPASHRVEPADEGLAQDRGSAVKVDFSPDDDGLAFRSLRCNRYKFGFGKIFQKRKPE